MSSSQWFCALLDTASDVYFRYALAPARGFAYVSPSVEALTGHPPADFYADRDFCLTLVAGRDRRLLWPSRAWSQMPHRLALPLVALVSLLSVPSVLEAQTCTGGCAFGSGHVGAARRCQLGIRE